MEKIFNNRTKILMLIFFIGIVLPLLTLKMDINEQQIKIYEYTVYGSTFYNLLISLTIGIAAFCIISIIPYLKNIDNTIKFDIGIDNLIGELHESQSSGNYSKATTIVYDLSSLAKSAINERIEKPIIKISQAVSIFVKLALLNQEDKSHPFSPFLIIHEYCTIAINVTNAKMDNVASSIISGLLESVKIIIEKNVLDGAAQEIIFTFHQIGIIAAEKHQEKTLTYSLRGLLTIYKVTSDNPNFEYDSENANKYFWICAARLIQDWPEQGNIIFNVIDYLGLNINSALPTKSIEHIKIQYPDVFEFLEKFIQKRK